MPLQLPALPFSPNALEKKGMCQETLELHHGKHHQAYIDKLNELTAKDPQLSGLGLEDLIKKSAQNKEMAPLFNNAGQHWNHIIFWKSLSPDGGSLPGKLEAKLKSDFGSVQAFKDKFKTAATGQFGSGWAWLVTKNGKLDIVTTPNGSNPLATGDGEALLGLDVWEHSYYLDFRNRRPDYVTNFLDKLANYEFAEANMNKKPGAATKP